MNETVQHLIANLAEAQRRLHEATGGKIDAVLLADSAEAVLLPAAQDDLLRNEAEQRRFATNLTSIIESVDQGIALFDQQLRIVTYNERLAELLNISRLDIPNGTGLDDIARQLSEESAFDSGENHEAFKAFDLVRSGDRQTVEYKRHDGRIASIVTTPIPNVGIVLVYADVTEMREREASLLRREESFRHLFVHSPMPKWVYHAETFRFLEVNNAAIAKYGYSREQFLTMTLKDIHAFEELARLEEFIAKPLSERQIAAGWKHRCKDGRQLDVDVFIRDLIFDDQPGRLAFVIDNTERNAAEGLTRPIFETSQDIIFVSDENRRLVRVSPSSTKILGFGADEMIGRYSYDFVFPKDLGALIECLNTAREGEDIQNFKCRYLHKGGHVVSLMWAGKWSAADRRYFFIGRDMTDYERAQQQLQQAQKMEAVGQLTGGVAHDFNNILMIIQAKVEAIEEGYPLDRALLKDIKVIGNAMQRAADLTHQLLAFSRKQPLRPQPTNINDLVAQTGKLLNRALGEQVELEAILADNLWNVEVDRAQFEASLVNLCINARDAMPQGGRLLIESQNTTIDENDVALNPDSAAGDYVLLTVADTGIGIPAPLLDRVLEPFFTTKAIGKGTGLGLSMVYGFIKQSKGHIKIKSEIDKGTTINIYLPKSRAKEEASREREPLRLPHGTERILVVEDDVEVRASVVRQLESLGYDVTEASDGQSGLQSFLTASRPFDLLLTDMVMPGALSGPGLAEQVARRWPETKVVFMSGYPADIASHEGRIDAGTCLLSKPFRKADLAKMIREVLQ